PGVAIEPDPETFPAYFLHGYVPCPRTLYRGIRQLEPGALLAIDERGEMQTRQYWTLKYPTEEALARTPPPPMAEAAARVRDLLDKAVERRLISDVPIGAFLSGGID